MSPADIRRNLIVDERRARARAAQAYTPTATQAVPLLEALIAETGVVEHAEVVAVHEEVLRRLGLHPPEDLLPYVLARLHTILCTECPRILLMDAMTKVDGVPRRVWGFRWVGHTAPGLPVTPAREPRQRKRAAGE